MKPSSNLFSLDDRASQPLALRMRPSNLDEMVGQQHLVAEGKPLRRMIEQDRFVSIILFGPPGCGKTTLAEVIAASTASEFERLNAADSGLSDLRKILQAAEERWRYYKQKTILFLDEIHRYSKSQQDALLSELERGIVKLIGATTQNPSFAINSPLISRSHVFRLEPLENEDMKILVNRAIHDEKRGLGPIKIDSEAVRLLIRYAEGDARKLLNALEMASIMRTESNDQDSEKTISLQDVEGAIQRKSLRYDHDEDEHYDTISAFIKSVRGSDPDSALYWLAKMIEGGEDPRFIARRLMILAAEDIGLADPHALTLAEAAAGVVERIGMPEGRIPLAEATLYLACAPKSNSALVAIDAALDAVRNESTVAIPLALRDTHYSGAKKQGHGGGYLYSHDYPEAITAQNFGIEAGRFYQPKSYGAEVKIKERLARWQAMRGQI
jgi:putative ATPase